MAHVKQITGNRGSDTSRVVITSTLFYCLHNPDTLILLQAEVRAALDDVVLERVWNPVATSALVLRLSPPLRAIMPRQALLGGLHVYGNFFPEGTEMGTPVYALHPQEHLPASA